MIEMEEEGCDAKFRNMFEQLQTGKLPIFYVKFVNRYLHDNLIVSVTCVSM